MNDYDDFDDAALERFSKRKDRRKPKGHRNVKALKQVSPNDPTQKFTDQGLQALSERGYLDDVIAELKSGKEATVYLARGREGLMAAKVYRDQAVRSFKRDGVYRQGRFIGDARIKKAIDQRTKSGLGAQQALWVFHEYQQLWELYRAGIPVPKPLVGPDPEAIGMAGRVVLMAYLGTETTPAPRLSDLRLTPQQAQDAWEQSLSLLVELLKLGKVHGDFSTYNLLWWQEKVWVIDLPQVVNLAENHQGAQLLMQDVTSLCTSFKRLRLFKDPVETLTQVIALAGRSDLRRH